MTQNLIRIADYHPSPPRFMHAIYLNGNDKPIRSTYLAKDEVELLDENSRPLKKFPLESRVPLEFSHEIILDAAHEINREHHTTIRDEIFHPHLDIPYSPNR